MRDPLPASPAHAAVRWRDLTALSRVEIVRELALPLPWLALALIAGHAGMHAITVLATFVLFMTGLRLTHNAFHRTLGLPRRGDDAVMFALSALLGGAMHAIEHTHLRHHARCMARDDVEGRVALLGFWRALAHSPRYPLLIHIEALRRGTRRQKRWIAAELATVAAIQIAIWCVSDSDTWKTISLSLLFANASAAMVGIWAVHRGCEDAHYAARTSRNPVLNALVGNMFHHLEHHLYPGVPTRRLPVLAQRLDAVATAPLPLVY